jgi:hypothetical protein
MSELLRSFPQKLDASQRADILAGSATEQLSTQVDRVSGRPPDLDSLDSLMSSAHDRQRDAAWPDRAVSDRWLAPRIHHALRLFRSEAADRGIWQWVALRYPWYVEWRWSDKDAIVAEDRWWGAIHKQAFARLWWGGEIFRDGADYRPVERAFLLQDLPNSYLHRPVVRCRSLALAIVDRLNSSPSTSARQVNSLARVLNLATVGSPPEVETDYQSDDLDSYNEWVLAEPQSISDWNDLPAGPPAADTTVASRFGGENVVNRGWNYAGLP